MYKVVWLSPIVFSEDKIKTTGTWLQPLAMELLNTGSVQIYNITRNYRSKEEKQNVCLGIPQWILPGYKKGEGLKRDEPKRYCVRIKQILDEIKPDVVQIWGTETKWATVYTQGYIEYPCFVDMQGVMTSLSPALFSGISWFEVLKCCSGIFELVHPQKSLLYKKYLFDKSAGWEAYVLGKTDNISVQSKWVEEYIRHLNSNAKIYKTNIILRDEFYSSEQWKTTTNQYPAIFTGSSASSITYKGLHVVLKALALVKRKYPFVKLKIMGEPLRKGLFISGYSRYIRNLIKELNLEENICFLGSLPASDIVSELQNSDMAVVSSFVESYSLALAESMMVGVPSLAAYSGAMPEFGVDKKDFILYTPTDYISLAQKMIELFENKDLARTIGMNGRQYRMSFNNKQNIVQNQIRIYRDIKSGINGDL